MGKRQPGRCPYLAHPQLPHLRHRRWLARADDFEFGEQHTNQAYWPLGRGQAPPLRVDVVARFILALWVGTDFTLTLSHPNPLHQVERELSSRERNFRGVKESRPSRFKSQTVSNDQNSKD